MAWSQHGLVVDILKRGLLAVGGADHWGGCGSRGFLDWLHEGSRTARAASTRRT